MHTLCIKNVTYKTLMYTIPNLSIDKTCISSLYKKYNAIKYQFGAHEIYGRLELTIS